MSRLLSYYGDDFTGSTDVMEALALNGMETVLFTRVPTAEQFAPFAGYSAVGLAGTSRSQSPQWMDAHLPPAFEWLKSLGARFCHYKVCSTFDSSPTVGSIGRAIEIGQRVFAQTVVPLVVGAPQIGRYTFAGHLFANYRGQTWRIDRHPVMSRHPVTPMDESDLRLHLARQTTLPVQLAAEEMKERGIYLVDVFDIATQVVAGERILGLPRVARPFLAGSGSCPARRNPRLIGFCAAQAGRALSRRVGQRVADDGTPDPLCFSQRLCRHRRGSRASGGLRWSGGKIAPACFGFAGA
jgi:hypothetical protein